MHVKLIEQSITNHILLFLKYKNSIGVVSEREIEPRALFFEQGEWKFIAYCRNRKELRLFLLNRIFSLEALNESFTPNQFSLEDYFK